MTVSYNGEVATCRGFGCFPKLLLRWRASIYKLIWMDICIYVIMYYALNLTYRNLLTESQMKLFEKFIEYAKNATNLIPLTFVLGFYVSIIVGRWWEQYMTLPWPDRTAVYVSALIRGQDEHGRKMRRTIMRYVVLSLTMTLTLISPRVKRLFPTLDHLIEAGLLVDNEKVILQNMNRKFSTYPKYWMPIVWASSIVHRARREGRIRDYSSLKTLIDALNGFRGMCMRLLFYDTISIPLVYTQVVTIAVYSYFFASIFGRQWTGDSDLYFMFPIFSTLEYLFFMGWLRVAESLICPFGDDDDDFEVDWMIGRNIKVSYLIVDEMHNEHPELIKDQYWDEKFLTKIADSFEFNIHQAPTYSTAYLNEKSEKKKMIAKLLNSLSSFSESLFGGRHPLRVDSFQDLKDGIYHEPKLKKSSATESEEKVDPLVYITSNQSFDTSKYQPPNSSEDNSYDEFEKLKKEREQERRNRHHNIFNLRKKSDHSNASSVIGTSKEGSNFKVSQSSSSENKKDI